HAITPGSLVPLDSELASRGRKSKIFIGCSQPMEGCVDQSAIFCVMGRQPEYPFDVIFNHFLCVVSYLSTSTVEETDVRRCQENASLRAGAHCRSGRPRDPGGPPRGMPSAAPAAPAGTGRRSVYASASAAACPRLTGSAVDPLI